MNDYERFNKEIRLDTETGELFWRVRGYGRVMNRPIGYKHDARGYRAMRFCGQVYYIHRVIFLLTYKRWPVNQVDHDDRNPSNNIPSNLKDATPLENQQNREPGLSGIIGVIYVWEKRKWRAVKRRTHLGYFDTAEAASLAYQEAP